MSIDPSLKSYGYQPKKLQNGQPVAEKVPHQKSTPHAEVITSLEKALEKLSLNVSGKGTHLAKIGFCAPGFFTAKIAKGAKHTRRFQAFFTNFSLSSLSSRLEIEGLESYPMTEIILR